MVVSSRAVAVLGFGLVGMSCLVGPSFAQQDTTVRKAANQQAATSAATPTAAPVTPPPAVFGTVDIRGVLKDYDKVKAQQEEFKAAAMAKHNELMKFQTEGQELAQRLQKLTPNTIDSKKIEDQITQLKAQLEAGRESAQREFALREADMMATLYKEVQEMVGLLAKHKKMTYVVQVNSEPISGQNPDSVMAAMSQTFVYYDPSTDLTREVVHYLNKRYKAAGGVTPKASATAPAATGAVKPAGN